MKTEEFIKNKQRYYSQKQRELQSYRIPKRGTHKVSFDLGSNRSKSKEINLKQMEQINKLRSVEQNLMKSVYGTLTHNESRFSTSFSQQALLECSGMSNRD